MKPRNIFKQQIYANNRLLHYAFILPNACHTMVLACDATEAAVNAFCDGCVSAKLRSMKDSALLPSSSSDRASDAWLMAGTWDD